MIHLHDFVARVGLSLPHLALSSFVRWISRPHYYVGDGVILTRTVSGLWLYLDGSDTNLTPSILIHGYWERPVSRFLLSRLRPGMRYVEVGANCGYFTSLAASRIGARGRGYAFDANARMVDLARRSMRINGLDWMSVDVAAVSDRSGAATLYIPPGQLGGANLYGGDHPRTEPAEAANAQAVEVRSITLDEFFGDDPDPIDLLKIDAEGAEPAILDGARRLLEHSPDVSIILEFYPDMLRKAGRDPAAFLQSLLDRGLRGRRIGRRGLESLDLPQASQSLDPIELVFDRAR